jgi:hypothetical protein
MLQTSSDSGFRKGRFCLVQDFFVQSPKNMFGVVCARFMMNITPWTEIQVQPEVLTYFPRYAYSQFLVAELQFE